MPEFSVIIPLYNKGPYIKRAIQSVLSQKIQDIELIIVDDGSADNGAEIVKNIADSRIRLIQQKNTGVSGARNRGVTEATGDFIAFLDADDEWMPHHLEAILRLMEKYPEAGMFTTAYKIQNADGKIQWADYTCIPDAPWEGLLPDYFISGALGHFPVNSSGVVMPKKIFHEMGGFPEEYWYGEDADLFGKIALNYPVAFSWEFGAIYHVAAANRACDRKIPLDYEEPFVKTARTALGKGDVRPDLVDSVNEYIARKEIFRASQNFFAGNLKRSEEILKGCNTKRQRMLKTKWMILAKIPRPIICFLKKTKAKVYEIIQKLTIYRS
jgi:glycosyltransferase involved in cell wall biosynthesis